MSWYTLTSNIAHIFALGGPMMWALLVVCLVLWMLLVERFLFCVFLSIAARAIIAAVERENGPRFVARKIHTP